MTLPPMPQKSPSVTIPLRYLLAARLCAAEKDVRCYLKGVCIRNGHIYGTNGHIALRITCPDALPLPDTIIPIEAIDFLVKRLKKHGDGIIGVSRSALTFGNIVENYTPIDGVFPDADRLIDGANRDPGMPCAQFQAAYLMTLEKVAVVLGTTAKVEHKITVLANGKDHAARVLFPHVADDVVACVAPLRV